MIEDLGITLLTFSLARFVCVRGVTASLPCLSKPPSTMPGSEHDTPAMVSRGKNLYFEKGLSINNTQSCNSCHPIDNKGSGADNLKTGKGAEGKSGDRNDPPTMNAGFQIAQFWDGRAATLEEQAQGPPLNPFKGVVTHQRIVWMDSRNRDRYRNRSRQQEDGDGKAISLGKIPGKTRIR